MEGQKTGIVFTCFKALCFQGLGVFMKYAEVAENVKRLVENPPSQDEFIYELLLAYGSPRSGVTLLKTGDTLDIELPELVTNYHFFIPLTPGLDKHTLSNENPADVRAAEKMAQLYDPDKMPDGLRQAHHNHTVDRLYRSKPFTSDEERLEHLFKLYEEMTAKEQLV
jgi:hypothetical protein